MCDRPTVIIYRNHLLRHSETFIQAQAESLTRFDYHYVGSRQVPGLSLHCDKVSTLHGPHLSQKVREGVYKLFGFSPFLLSEVKSHSPHLIHAHFGPDAVRAIPLAKALNIPLVVTFHGYSVTIKPTYALRSSYSQFIYTLKKHQLQREGTHFIAVSDFLKNCLIAQGFPKKRVSTHYIGIDTDLFTCQEQASRTQSVLFVGRLVEVKGCEFFIREMTKVQAVFPDCEAIIVGDGPLRQFLEQLASRVLHKFRFLGVQPSSVVRS
ncbi:MAG: glycosyltransferase, partial [Cyanobacteria bacterium P01_D01_bin.56]